MDLRERADWGAARRDRRKGNYGQVHGMIKMYFQWKYFKKLKSSKVFFLELKKINVIIHMDAQKKSQIATAVLPKKLY